MAGEGVGRREDVAVIMDAALGPAGRPGGEGDEGDVVAVRVDRREAGLLGHQLQHAHRARILVQQRETEGEGILLQLMRQLVDERLAVDGGGRWPSSGIHWRSGVIVTAEEVLERDDNIKLTLPGGRVADASLAGRDPTTDVAVLRFQPDGLPVGTTADARLRVGQVVLAMGNHDGEPLAAFGIVALAGGAWHSIRGGTIDSLIRLDLALSPAAEGGALVDLQGRVIGMTVLGPRRRALSIPSSTIDRAVDQLLARGHVFRGYLGAGLQPMKEERASGESQASRNRRGVLVVSIDPNGPSARAGAMTP